MTKNPARLAYILLTLTTLFWGGNSVAGKMAVGEISPMLLTLSRWLIAVALIAPFAMSSLRTDWPVIRRHWMILAFYGSIGFTLFNVLLYGALTMTTAVNASIMQAAIPASVYLLNYTIFGLRVTIWQIAGFVVTLAGVAVVSTHGQITRLVSLDLNGGDALVLVAVVIYALFTVFLRFKPVMNWKSLIVVLGVIASMASLPFVWWEWQAGKLIVPGSNGLWVALYAGIFPSIVSQIFFIKGVELIGANRAGIFTNLIPIFGTGLAILIIGEPLETFHITALLLVIAGIWLAERKAK